MTLSNQHNLLTNVNTKEIKITRGNYTQIAYNFMKEYANNITTTIRDNWEKLATKYGLSRDAIEYIRPAFGECY